MIRNHNKLRKNKNVFTLMNKKRELTILNNSYNSNKKIFQYSYNRVTIQAEDEIRKFKTLEIISNKIEPNF